MPQPVAVTPAVTRAWNEAIAAGDRLPYGLVCFDTQDRLTYQAWIDDQLRWIRQANAIMDHYETAIRDARRAAAADPPAE